MNQIKESNNINEQTAVSIEKVLTTDKPGNGLRILGIVIICFSLFIIIVPIMHTITNGFKPQYTPVLIIGTIIFALGVGLFLRHYWAWISSSICFSLIILNNLVDLIRTQNSTAISNSFIAIIVLVTLSRCKDQVIRKQN